MPGTFYFDNPGLDIAQFDDANILSPKRQSEVNDVIEKLKDFRPTKIFAEYPVESQQKVDNAVMKYKAGDLPQNASEVNQLAYRLAKELNLPIVYAVDYRKTSFPFDSLVKEMSKAQQFDLLARNSNLPAWLESPKTAERAAYIRGALLVNMFIPRCKKILLMNIQLLH
jgi:hypothetical protein